MPKLHELKPEDQLKMTPAAIRMRLKRANVREINEKNFLESQALCSKQYRLKVKNKTVKTQQPNSDENENINTDKDEDISVTVTDNSVKITLPDVDDIIDDDIINEAFVEVQNELARLKMINQIKNKKRKIRKNNRIKVKNYRILYSSYRRHRLKGISKYHLKLIIFYNFKVTKYLRYLYEIFTISYELLRKLFMKFT